MSCQSFRLRTTLYKTANNKMRWFWSHRCGFGTWDDICNPLSASVVYLSPLLCVRCIVLSKPQHFKNASSCSLGISLFKLKPEIWKRSSRKCWFQSWICNTCIFFFFSFTPDCITDPYPRTRICVTSMPGACGRFAWEACFFFNLHNHFLWQ